jgi:GH35 family endo-1,4-beta-xylanase
MLVLVLASAASGQPQPPSQPGNGGAKMDTRKLPEGTPVLPEDALSAFRLSGGETGNAKMESVAVEGRQFGKALRVQTIKRPANPWLVQLIARSAAAVEKGDVLLGTFWLRCAESMTGEAATTFVFEVGRDPYTKSADFLISAGTAWKLVHVPFLARQSFGVGEASINFQLGYGPQTVEIGGISVVNYGKKVKLKDLPHTSIDYAGREPNAPWRKEAAERIEKLRKADLTVTVTDAAGNPVAGADVAVKMTRHAFGFGSAVSAQGVMDTSENGDKYREFIRKHFNKVVFENDLKWGDWAWENLPNRQRMFKAYDWLHSGGIEVRGHCLVWPGWGNMPPDVKQKKDDKAALAKRINDHVTEEAAAMRGKLVEWDVINEPYSNHDVQDVLGDDCMVEWFKLARAADANVELFINDYSILSQGGLDTAHQDHYEKTIRFLIEKGAPLDGIGMQGHFGTKLTAPTKMLEILDRFAKLGKQIEVTEFDSDITDEELQADFTRDFHTTLFSHPSVKGILMWGFWESRHWKPNGAMVRKDWTLKPNGQAWVDLVFKQWWTDVKGKADAAGRYAVRGFLGDYEITATSGGKSKTVKASLPKAGQGMKVVLE